MNLSYMLTARHAWIVILNAKIEQLCKRWATELPAEEADDLIDSFMTETRCLRQGYVHRCNFYKYNAIVEKELTKRLA